MKTCPRCNLRYPDTSTACFVDGTLLVPMPDPRLGTVLAGQYLIERVLAEGGMATVYVARHRLTDRHCAIKVLNASLSHNKVVRERFAREAGAAQKLSHPNIIEILDQGSTNDGMPFLVMDLLSGETLASALMRGPLPLWRALSVMVQIARALSRAHDMGVIHRDLKPDNIFLCDDTQRLVKLLDFGIARSLHDPRLTGQGEIFGTAQYLAPERISSIDAGHSADLYSFGIIAFEMLTGRLPFAANDAASWLVSHITGQIPSVASFGVLVPQELDLLVQALMAKKPEQRPVDAHRVHADLTTICASIGLCISPEMTKTIASSWQPPPPKTEHPRALESWGRRLALFERMLTTAYGPRPPASMQSLLSRIRTKVEQVATLRASEAAAQVKLESLRATERDAHQRLGFAADALGDDLSRAREEARRAHSETEESSARCEQLAAHVQQLCTEIRNLEDAAIQGPSSSLSQMWRDGAEAMDAWGKAVEQQAVIAQNAEQADRIVMDLEYQIHELRSGLDRLSQATEHERKQLEASITQTGCQVERLQNELLEHATELCSPLRTFPVLSGMFLELETES